MSLFDLIKRASKAHAPDRTAGKRAALDLARNYLGRLRESYEFLYHIQTFIDSEVPCPPPGDRYTIFTSAPIGCFDGHAVRLAIDNRTLELVAAEILPIEGAPEHGD